MPNRSPAEIHRDLEHTGVVFPIDVIPPEEATSLLDDYERIATRMGDWTDTPQLIKVHVVSEAMWNLICTPSLIDAVEAIIGPDILCWGATFFAKSPQSGGYVGWHQDLTYWGLSPAPEIVTAWIALTDARVDNGCMSVISGSHHGPSRQHTNQPGDDNLLLSGQKVELTSDEQSNLVHCELEPGQASIHHCMALHGSNPNQSARPRVGLSVQYISANVVQSNNGGVDSAMAVRGDTTRSRMIQPPPPVGEFTDSGLAVWKNTIGHPSGLGATADNVDLVASVSRVS